MLRDDRVVSLTVVTQSIFYQSSCHSLWVEDNKWTSFPTTNIKVALLSSSAISINIKCCQQSVRICSIIIKTRFTRVDKLLEANFNLVDIDVHLLVCVYTVKTQKKIIIGKR